MALETSPISDESATRVRPKNTKASGFKKTEIESTDESRVEHPILLIEDSRADSELFRIISKKALPGTNLVTARDGSDALDMLYSRGAYANETPLAPSLIVLDLKMPRVDGIEVLRSIRQHMEFAATPIVVFTASKRDKEIETALQLGADAFVIKPTSFKELQQAVRHILNFRTTQKAAWA